MTRHLAACRHTTSADSAGWYRRGRLAAERSGATVSQTCGGARVGQGVPKGRPTTDWRPLGAPLDLGEPGWTRYMAAAARRDELRFVATVWYGMKSWYVHLHPRL